LLKKESKIEDIFIVNNEDSMLLDKNILKR